MASKQLEGEDLGGAEVKSNVCKVCVRVCVSVCLYVVEYIMLLLCVWLSSSCGCMCVGVCGMQQTEVLQYGSCDVTLRISLSDPALSYCVRYYLEYNVLTLNITCTPYNLITFSPYI